jgi:hypothetical protein
MGKKIVFIVTLSVFIFNILMPYELIGIVGDVHKKEMLIKKSYYAEKVVFPFFGADSIKIDGILAEKADSVSLDATSLLKKITLYSPTTIDEQIVHFLKFENKSVLIFDEEYKGLYDINNKTVIKYANYFNAFSFIMPALSLLLIPSIYFYANVIREEANDYEKKEYIAQVQPTFYFFMFALLYSLTEVMENSILKRIFKDKTDITDIKENYTKGFNRAVYKNRELENLNSQWSAFNALHLGIPAAAALALIWKGCEYYRVDIYGVVGIWGLFILIQYIKNQIFLNFDKDRIFIKASMITKNKDMFFLRGYIDGCYEK